MKTKLIRTLSQWEVKRIDRLILEEKYKNYTGHIDIAELHIPYTHWEDVDKMITRAESIRGNKMLFLAGDSLNLDLFSRFYQRSTDKSKPSEEIETLIKFMKMAEKIYDKILFMISNHEARLTKVIMQYIIHKEIAQEILNLIEGYYDIFTRNKLEKFEIIENYLFHIGNVLICHFENNSSVPGSILRQLIQYLGPRVNKNWDVVFQAHTHCQGDLTIDLKKGIETGCLTDSLDYWINGKMHGRGKHSTLGWAYCDMVKGKADINDCRYMVTKWQGWI